MLIGVSTFFVREDVHILEGMMTKKEGQAIPR